jgi:transcriptional regulator with XRE-family HTH domain
MSSGNGSFGVRLKALREGMDLSLRDLADRSGVSAPMLSQVERAKRARR